MWHFLDMPGERFEYETGMLIRCVRRKILFQEMEIRTVYIENNRGSHFRAFRDSLSVYRVLFGYFFKFCLSSLSAAALDLIVFQLTLMCIASLEIRGEVWIATAFARLCSSLYNYFVNKRVVFKTSGGRRELLRYYMLSVAVFICSAGLVDLARTYIKSVPVVILKAVIDACLFLVSYQIQQRFVFTARTKKEK